MAHDADAHESMGRAERASEPRHSSSPENVQPYHHINRRIEQIAQGNPKLGPEEIRRTLFEEGYEVSPEHVIGVLQKHHINLRILAIHRENPKLGPEGIRRTLFEEGYEVSSEHVADVLNKLGLPGGVC